MKKILISTSSFAKVDPSPIELLKSRGFNPEFNPFGRTLSKDEIIKLASQARGIIAGTEKLDREVLSKLTNLKVISRCGSGLDSVDLKVAEELGIKVFNTPDGPSLAVAELTIGLIFALLRKIPLMDREVRSDSWNKKMGNLLFGKQVGVIGFGKIGRKVAVLLKALGAHVIFFDPFLEEKEVLGFSNTELSTLLKESDIITLHLPYSKENCNLIGKKEISSMKKDAFLVNCSRGGIVDEDVLYLALNNNKLSGAAIDVFVQEPYKGQLKELDNVILTPHIGSYAKEARVKMELEAAGNLIKGLEAND